MFELENFHHVKLGFQAHIKYRKLVLLKFKEMTHLDFAKSSYYKSFSEFGKYLDDIQVINLDDFMGFLVDRKIPFKKWHNPMIYEHYLKFLHKKETAEDAVVRTLKIIESWSLQTGLPQKSFFHHVDTGYFLILVRTGRFSPWVFFNAESVSEIMRRMTDEELSLMTQSVEPTYWELKFAENRNDVAIVKEVLRQYGI